MAAPVLIPRFAFGRSAGGGSQDILVNIFLRGGMDGLSLVPPYGDPDLYVLRPTLGVPPPGSGDGAAYDLDGYFGLAPGARGLLKPYQDGKLLLVHASGSTDPTRSHFDAMAFMEFGNPNQGYGSVNTGWLGRHLNNVAPLGNGPLRGITVDYFTPPSCEGGPLLIATPDPANFTFPGDPQSAGRRRRKLENMYEVVGDPVKAGAMNGLAAIDLLATVDFANYQPENGAQYADDYFAQGLKKIAAMIKANLGVEVFTLDIHGWDTHALQGTTEGYLHELFRDLCDALEAFYLDMQSWMDRLVVLGMSEFGRRAAENASAGTDHGHGNALFVMGGHIKGGRVLTNPWPTLKSDALDDGDLAITADYRDIVAEILNVRMCDDQVDTLFPNYTPTFLGITQ
jgi:uncharacterized protein (DUF1501 family)